MTPNQRDRGSCTESPDHIDVPPPAKPGRYVKWPARIGLEGLAWVAMFIFFYVGHPGTWVQGVAIAATASTVVTLGAWLLYAVTSKKRGERE